MKIPDKILAVAQMTDNGCSSYYGFIPKIIEQRGYEKGIEIGVLFGGHAKAMLDNECLKILVGIDPYLLYEQPIPGLESQEDFDAVYEFAMERLSDPRYFHFRGTSDQAFPLLEHTVKYDFVFIDGLHTYDQIKRDMENFSQIIRTGGMIACHDYDHPNFPELTTAINEFAEYHGEEVVICGLHTIYINKTW
jgi:hypothetical protein